MGFLSPWFLGGLLVAGLPVWLHLLRQHRNTPMQFASLMFFERRTDTSVRRRRLRHLLLLALRLAVLILLALAFANPFIKTTAPIAASSQKLVVLAVDQSFSMRQGDQLAAAKQQALNTVSSVRSQDRGQVIAFANRIHVMNEPTRDPNALRAAIAGIEQTDGASSYGELVRSLRGISDNNKLPLEVHLFSDLQKSSLPPGFADLQLAPNTKLVFHPTVNDARPNWTVESVIAPRRIFGQTKNRVQATIAGFMTDEATRSASLVLDGKVLESKPVKVAPGGRATVEFNTLESGYGFHKGEVRIDGADKFPQDDRYLFAVERADPRKILFVHEARNTRGPLYYRTALESASQGAFTIDAVTTDQVANLDPSRYSFVVLSDVSTLPPAFEQKLGSFVTGGGAMLAALGPGSASQSKVPVVGLGLRSSRYFERTGERFDSIGKFDATHPALANANAVEGVKFFQVIDVDPGKSRVVARTGSGAPLLIDQSVGEGRALIFASTFDNISNDFPLRPSFLPFVLRSAQYLSGEQDAGANLAVGSFLELRSSRDRATSVEVTDPHGKRALTLDQATKAESYELPEEGFYEVRRSNGRQSMVAANADRRESNLDIIPKETLSLWENTGQGTGPAGDAGSTDNQTQKTFWWYLALLLLIAALAESLFGSNYLARDRDEIPLDRREAA